MCPSLLPFSVDFPSIISFSKLSSFLIMWPNKFIFLFMMRMEKILKSKVVSTRVKLRLIDTIVFPVMSYGSGSWALKKTDQRKIDAFELWAYKRILRITRREKKTNASMPDKCKRHPWRRSSLSWKPGLYLPIHL